MARKNGSNLCMPKFEKKLFPSANKAGLAGWLAHGRNFNLSRNDPAYSGSRKLFQLSMIMIMIMIIIMIIIMDLEVPPKKKKKNFFWHDFSLIRRVKKNIYNISYNIIYNIIYKYSI